VILGLVGIANTIVVGAAFIGPESGKLARLAEERGYEDPQVGSARGADLRDLTVRDRRPAPGRGGWS
jgi:hypothetical protein